MKATVPTLLFASSLLFTSQGIAQHRTFDIDPGSSIVAFGLGDVLHSVHGIFRVQSGIIKFDRTGADISGSVVVAAGSGESGNESRDRKMSNDILHAAKFGEVFLVPHRYQGTIAPSGNSKVQVTGTFTLLGTPHELTVPMQIYIDGSNCTAKTEFTVPYVKWGLKDPSNFILRVDKEVKISLSLVGRISP